MRCCLLALAMLSLTGPLQVQWDLTWLAIAGLCSFRIRGACAARAGGLDIRRRRSFHHLALHDPLTDLPNRELFDRRLQAALARPRRGRFTALLLIDLDNFKTVNDRHGHGSGDMMLVAMAERLLANIRGSDTAARLGGDEFAVIVPDLTFAGQAHEMANRILQSIAAPLTLPSGGMVTPRASVGIALSPLDATDPRALLDYADMALYAVKRRGGQSRARYQPQMGAVFRAHRDRTAELATRWHRGQFALVVQPRRDLVGGLVEPVAAMVAWRPGKLPSEPREVLALVRDTGLLDEIGPWLFEQACAAAERLPGSARLGVSIDGGLIADPNLASWIARALETSGIAPHRLHLELPQAAVLADEALARQTIRGLQQAGVSLTLGALGTAGPSLGCLVQYRFDAIRLDPGFVEAGGEVGEHIARAILDLARNLDMAVLVEETDAAAYRRVIARPRPVLVGANP